MRLLMTADTIGGVWQYATELAGALAGRGVAVTLAAIGPAPVMAQRTLVPDDAALVETGLTVDWLCNSPDALADAGAAIAGLARRRRADLVHLNSPALAAVAMPCPTVVVDHGGLATWWEHRGTAIDPGLAWQRDAARAGLLAAGRVAAPTRAHAEAVARAHGLPGVPAAVHNGRTAPTASPAAEPVAAAVTVGRLWDEVKNAAFLDRVAGRMRTPLTAIGALAGPRGERVELGRLRAPGTVDAATLRAELADRVFVSAACFEPFGLAVLEAAQLGCPLVLSDIAGFRELWDGAALFLPLGDEPRWAAAIDALIADRPRRRALGAAARERAGRYTPARMADGMLTIYGQLLGARAAA